MSFNIWKHAVDQILVKRVGLDSDSLEDWCWRDCYEGGELPAHAVEEFLMEMQLEANF